MALVFEIYKPDGSLYIDLATRIPRFLGSQIIYANQLTGTITHPGFATGQPFFIPVDWRQSIQGAYPELYIENNSIRWDRKFASGAAQYDLVLDYGVY